MERRTSKKSIIKNTHNWIISKNSSNVRRNEEHKRERRKILRYWNEFQKRNGGLVSRIPIQPNRRNSSRKGINIQKLIMVLNRILQKNGLRKNKTKTKLF